MKKTLTIALALTALAASAQDTKTTPNRMIIQSQVGAKAYAIDKVDSIYFGRQDGEVRADVKFLKYNSGITGDTIWTSVTRTAGCESFCFDILPTNTASRYSDDVLARYFEQQNSTKYYQDFSSGMITGFEEGFKSNTSYTIVTLGYDGFGVPCESSRAEFTTPKISTVGTPSVTWTVDEVTPTSFTLTVTPNADAAQFYWCQFDKGGLDEQFAQWGPMFGFANKEAMIMQFSGYSYSTATTYTWNNLAPGKDYEVDVVPVDVNGNCGDIVTIPVTTTRLGGDGVAEMTITVGDMMVVDDSTFYVPITYTPNDQVGVFHDLLMTKEYYDANFTDEQMAELLKQDTNPFSPYDPSWNQYKEDADTWNVDPSTTYCAVTIGQNGKGEWGPFVKKEFTTAAYTPSGAKRAKASVGKASGVAQRVAKGAPVATKRFGVVPAKKGGLKLEMAK